MRYFYVLSKLITAKRADSIYSGKVWRDLLTYSNRINDEDNRHEHERIIREFIYKSCMQSNKDELLIQDTNLPFIQGSYHGLFDTIVNNRVFGVPEICISPVRVDHFFTDFVRPVEEDNIIEADYNYTKLCPSIPCTDLKDSLNRIENKIVQNQQAPILHMHTDFKDASYTFTTEMTNAQELGEDSANYNYKGSYLDPPTARCAFETVLYTIMKSYIEAQPENFVDIPLDEPEEPIVDGPGPGSGPNRVPIGGAITEQQVQVLQNQKLPMLPTLSAQQNNKLKILESRTPSQAPSPAPEILIQTANKVEVPEVKVDDKAIPVLEMTKNKIPILYYIPK